MSLVRPSILSLVAFFALLALCVQSPVVHGVFWNFFPSEDHGESMRKEYDLINNYLADHMQTLDAVEVIKRIRTMVDNVVKKRPGAQRIVLGKYKLLTSELLKLAALGELFEDPIRCDIHATNLLLSLDKYTRVKINQSPDEKIPRRTLETLLRDIAEQHAYDCRYAYTQRLSTIKKKPENEYIFKEVAVAMDAVIASNTKRIFYRKDIKMDKRALLKEMARGIPNMRSKEQAVHLVYFIRIRADQLNEHRYLFKASDPKRTGRWQVDMEKVTELTTKYLFRPCEQFVKATKNVLLPAEFDQSLGPTDNRYRAIDEKITDMMINLEYFRLCRAILNEDREAFMHNVEEIIWDSSFD